MTKEKAKTIKPNAKQVTFTTVDGMGNERSLIFTVQDDGFYRLTKKGGSLANYQFDYAVGEIVLEANDQNWAEVERMISTGTHIITNINSK